VTRCREPTVTFANAQTPAVALEARWVSPELATVLGIPRSLRGILAVVMQQSVDVCMTPGKEASNAAWWEASWFMEKGR
jgi:hypothetical protein